MGGCQYRYSLLKGGESLKKSVARILSLTLVTGFVMSSFAFAFAVVPPCVHTSYHRPMYFWNQDRYSYLNPTQHGYYVFVVIECTSCWNRSGGEELMATYNHSKSTVDRGHSGSVHNFSEYCYTCDYTLRSYSLPCSGPPCNTVWSSGDDV